MMGIVAIATGLILGVICLQIVNQTIVAANFTAGSLLDIVTENIPVLFGVTLLLLAVGGFALGSGK